MKKFVLFFGAAALICCFTLPTQAQRGGGGRGGFNGGFDRGFDRGRDFGRDFGRWGYPFGPYNNWAFYGALYGYPYSPYSYYYYPQTMYYVPPAITTQVVPSVTYYPVEVPVPVLPTPNYNNFPTGGTTVAPAAGFTSQAPPPSYPGFIARPSTASSSGYYPDVPDRK
jgi:hypothetical protein